MHEADIPQVMHLMRLYHDETLPDEVFSPQRAARLLTFCRTQPERYCCFVARVDICLAGFICGRLTDKLISEGRYVEDKGIFVARPYRCSVAAYLLGTAFLKWAEATDAHYVRGEAALDAPIMQAATVADYKTVGYINRREITRHE